jgi:hypothetical protein
MICKATVVSSTFLSELIGPQTEPRIVGAKSSCAGRSTIDKRETVLQAEQHAAHFCCDTSRQLPPDFVQYPTRAPHFERRVLPRLSSPRVQTHHRSAHRLPPRHRGYTGKPIPRRPRGICGGKSILACGALSKAMRTRTHTCGGRAHRGERWEQRRHRGESLSAACHSAQSKQGADGGRD